MPESITQASGDGTTYGTRKHLLVDAYRPESCRRREIGCWCWTQVTADLDALRS